jgi:chromosome segregation ATPase
MSELDGNKTIEQLLAELQEARKRLDETTEAEQAARMQSTNARNVYNGLTKRLDAAYAKLRASAPRDTDWNQAGKGGLLA